MALHVVQLGPVPPPEGGITRNISAIKDELASRGHVCTLVATSKSSAAPPKSGTFHPRSAGQLLALLRSIGSDILHLHLGGEITIRVLLMALASAWLGRGRKILTLHSGGFALIPDEEKPPFAGYVFRQFGKVIAVNDALAETFRRLGVPQANVETILPFALHPPKQTTPMPRGLREFCAAHSPLLVSVGGMEKDYEPILQIEAFKEIRERFPNAGLLIVGGGSLTDSVCEHLQREDLSKTILAAGGLEHDVVLHLISEADLMLRITLFDGDAISVREALYLGTPVVATDNGLRPRGVRVVPIGDRHALVAAVAEELSVVKAKSEILPPPDNSNIRRVVDLYEELAGEMI